MAVSLPQVKIQIDVPKDKAAERVRWARWLVDGTLALLTLYIPYKVLWYVGSVLDHPVVGGLIGLGLGFWLLGWLAPKMVIDNPEWSGYITQNPFFGGWMVTYGPGIHPAYPWEERNAAGNYSLGVITRPFSLTVPTTSSAIKIDGRLFYNASLKYLQNAVGVDREVVEEGLVAFIDSYLIALVSSKSAEEVKRDLTDIGTELNVKFRDQAPAPNSTGSTTPEEFEQKFGFSTAVIALDNIAYTKEVQEALDAVSKTRKMTELVLEYLGGITRDQFQEMIRTKTISVAQVKELSDRARVDAGIVKMNLNVVEGSMGDAALNFLAKGGR